MKDLSIEQRFLLAFLLTSLVFFGWSYFVAPPPPAETEVVQSTPEELPKAAGENTPAIAVDGAQETAQDGGEEAPVAAASEQTETVETDKFRVTFSNRGGVVRSWVLKDFTDAAGKPLEMVNQKALTQTGTLAVAPPFSILFGNQIANVDPNTALFQMQKTTGGVRFQYVRGATRIEKSFEFEPDTYLFNVTSRVIDNGVAVPHSLVWRGGFGDETVDNPAAFEAGVYYDGGREKTGTGDDDEPPVTLNSGFGFAGIEDKYFAAIALTGEGQGSVLEFRTLKNVVPKQEGDDTERVGVAIGGSANNQLRMFVGPKNRDVLASVDPRLDELIDWGTYFGIVARPMFYLLKLVQSTLTPNWGWSIVIVTLILNTVLMPLRISSIKSSRKMAAIQPQVKAIQEKYKGLPMNDPKRTEQQQEMSALYEKHGVSMTGGCVPMLMQLPVFIALYTVLSVSIELRHASWLWVADLAQPETLPIRVLPVVLVITQFLTQRMTPSPGMDPSMQKSMMIMPVVMGFMFYYQSAGLVLYWLTSNLVGIVQQVGLNRFYPAPAKVEVIQPPSASKKKKKG